MTDPAIPTYGAVRAAYVTDREREYRRESRGIPTDAQRAQWSAEFDRWADAIHATAWDEGYAVAVRYQLESMPVYLHPAAPGSAANPTNPYRED